MTPGTYLLALVLVALALLVVGVFAPVAVAVRIVAEEGIVGGAGGIDVVLSGQFGAELV